MGSIDNIHPSFITNAKGEKISVILPIDEFGALIEDLEDLATIAERNDEETISHQQVIQELRQDGILQD